MTQIIFNRKQFITLMPPDTLASFIEILFIATGTIHLALARFALLRLHQPTTLFRPTIMQKPVIVDPVPVKKKRKGL